MQESINRSYFNIPKVVYERCLEVPECLKQSGCVNCPDSEASLFYWFPETDFAKTKEHPGFRLPVNTRQRDEDMPQMIKNPIHSYFKLLFYARFGNVAKIPMIHPNAIWAQLQHLQTCQVVQVGDGGDFVVNQKKFFQLGELLHILHFPQNVKGNVKQPAGSL